MMVKNKSPPPRSVPPALQTYLHVSPNYALPYLLHAKVLIYCPYMPYYLLLEFTPPRQGPAHRNPLTHRVSNAFEKFTPISV